MEATVMSMEKCVGLTIDIIYLDRKGRFTQRRITVHSVRGDRVRAYDHTRQGPRTFRAEGILAREPVSGHAS
jgi:predicted DNA-binding transcriptional regulator YafY